MLLTQTATSIHRTVPTGQIVKYHGDERKKKQYNVKEEKETRSGSFL